MIVLDASAIIALYRREPGWERVLPLVSTGAISAANLSEALTKFVEDGGDVNRMAEDIALSGCEIVPVSAAHAIAAAKLRPATRPAGLSLGGRICLALALERQCAALTADRSWAKVAAGVAVEFVR